MTYFVPFIVRLRPTATYLIFTATSLAAMLLPVGVAGADLGYFGVAKGILFTQTSSAPPVIRGGLPYAFQAVVQPPTNLITSARVQWSLADLPLAAITTPNALGFVQRVRTQDILDATFPSGSYRIATQTVNDSNRVSQVTILGNDYPFPPILQTFPELQAINPAEPLTLAWNVFGGGTTNDLIYVQIENSQGRVFATGMYPGAPEALSGTTTSVVIPPQTLQPGRAYTARVVFHRFTSINTADYPGAIGTGGYFAQTDFSVATTGGGDVTPPSLVGTSPAAGSTNVPINTPVIFRFNETMGRGFALGISPGSFGRTFDWSPDGRSLVATPVTNWPPNTTLFWTLNLYYAQLAFGDTNANPLPMESVLSFTTGSTVETNPAPVLVDQKILPNGRFQFLVAGQSNRIYTIQATTNLTQWTSISTQVAFTGQIEFLDTNAPALPHRAYRAFGR